MMNCFHGRLRFQPLGSLRLYSLCSNWPSKKNNVKFTAYYETRTVFSRFSCLDCNHLEFHTNLCSQRNANVFFYFVEERPCILSLDAFTVVSKRSVSMHNSYGQMDFERHCLSKIDELNGIEQKNPSSPLS